jgi:hypothetical protein
MGIEVFLCWNDPKTEKETWEYVLKLYYPTAFNYSQAEIPDGSCPRDLDVKYLKKYLEWMGHLKFLAQKLPDAFMQYMKNATSMDLSEILECLDQDENRIKNTIEIATQLQSQRVKCWLSVG